VAPPATIAAAAMHAVVVRIRLRIISVFLS